MRVYLTHCSKEKNPELEITKAAVTPDQLYTNPEIQKFMEECKKRHVNWAILSDLYGVFESNEHREWYEKHPETVTATEENAVIQNFDSKLDYYDEIWFYVRPASFHPFYQRVLSKTVLANRVRFFQDIYCIE